MEHFILAQIHSKINPYHSDRRGATVSACTVDKKMYISGMCSAEEFLRMFPDAQAVMKKDKKVVPLRKRNRFKTTTKIYQRVFKDVRELDAVFGQEWDVIFNGTAVGCVLPPISFRLLSTTINSHQTALSKELEQSFLVKSSKLSTFTTSSITLLRSSFSRWGPRNAGNEFTESEWQKAVEELQRSNVSVVSSRMKHKKVK